ncbi:ABC transporter ATP-binding protein [Amnibacterium sp.]|jgi:molybdate transport system ATP-binding protein|uniref:ABC transporter ATP-binding protein n=1 Tax=Amnibacterium sp. TaxID=1872496 RepID=UPI002609A907|nr:ATP-binding cassette domain-containing protein [Amnibacterium sp.]MCU1473676.1 transporter ATP-binding protein [Amnibacterium sp.]
MTGALEARLGVRRGAFELDAELVLAPGTVLAVVGRNGAGKSTALATLAGITPLSGGRIVLDGVLLDDGGRGFEPPERRPVGLVLQQPALFPHLTVLDNVAFGLRAAGAGRADAREQAQHALEDQGLGDFTDRRPSQVSGGQAARIALVRALVRRPALLLLDEPLAAIDAELRPALRASIRGVLDSFPGSAIVVTHDVADAEALADEVVVLDSGRVLQRGPLAGLRAEPADPVVTRLLAGAGQDGGSGG